MWKKNGLIFTSKVKISSFPLMLETMYHYLQIMLLNVKPDDILKYLPHEYCYYFIIRFKLNDKYIRNYYQYLVFLLTLITNPIITKENKEIKLEKDVIHFLNDKPKTITSLIEKCINI